MDTNEPPDLDIEDALFLDSPMYGAFPTPPTPEAYYSLIYESGDYIPTQAGVLFPPPVETCETADAFYQRTHTVFFSRSI